MKKFISLFILAVTISIAGCSGYEPTYTMTDDSASTVKGHTYKYTKGSDYISMYFASNHVCSYRASVNGTSVSTSNLTYMIDGNNVDVYTDNSTYWLENKRNTLLFHMIYSPSSDCLTCEDHVFCRYD